MTLTEKVLFIVTALLLAYTAGVVAAHTLAAPWDFIVGGTTGFVVGYGADKLWRRWNK